MRAYESLPGRKQNYRAFSSQFAKMSISRNGSSGVTRKLSRVRRQFEVHPSSMLFRPTEEDNFLSVNHRHRKCR